MKNTFRLFSQNLSQFSTLTRTRRFMPNKNKKEIEFKRMKLQENKLYDGMDSMNTNDIDLKKEEKFYPIQHVPLINNPDSYIIPYKKTAKNLTTYNEIPNELYKFEPPDFVSPHDSKGLDVGIIGPPNSGKSSLFNKIVGTNVSAVSSKYNTTNDKIEGVFTDVTENIQLNLFDTAGAIKANDRLNSKKIITKSWSVIPDCDKILFVVDAVKSLDLLTKEAIKRFLKLKFTPANLKFMSKLKNMNVNEMTFEELDRLSKELREGDKNIKDYESKNISSILVMNKMDLVTNKRKLRSLQEELEDLGTFDKTFHVSVQTGYGISGLVNYLKNESQRRPWKYHPVVKTTMTEIEKCQEILRQNIYNRFYQEVPYECGSKLKSWVPKSNGELDIVFEIEVKNKNIIGMVLGPKGKNIKELREETEKDLTIYYQRPVKVNIFVVHRHKKAIELLNVNPED